MDPEVQRLASDSGALTANVGIAEVGGGRVAAVRFEFEHGALQLTCDDDTDEIVVAALPLAAERLPGQIAIEHEAFEGLLGCRLDYAWEMHNHRGYRDGFQLRFRDGRGDTSTIQFECGASALDVLRVLPSASNEMVDKPGPT